MVGLSCLVRRGFWPCSVFGVRLVLLLVLWYVVINKAGNKIDHHFYHACFFLENLSLSLVTQTRYHVSYNPSACFGVGLLRYVIFDPTPICCLVSSMFLVFYLSFTLPHLYFVICLLTLLVFVFSCLCILLSPSCLCIILSLCCDVSFCLVLSGPVLFYHLACLYLSLP